MNSLKNDLTPPEKKPARSTKHKQHSSENYHFVGSGKKSKKYDAAGVWFDDGESIFLICSPLEILAETQTEAGENYGRLLRWSDSKNRVHIYAMPIEQIHGEGTDLIKYLVSHGLSIGTTRKHYEHLRAYINLSSPEKTIISTDKIGWNGAAFVLPDAVFGSGEDEMIYQTEFTGFDKFSTKGTLDEWREKIAKNCAGNSRLVFAVSTAFACPLLPIAEVTGGGFHFRGLTSSGKTTALLAAGSVCGGSDEMHGYSETWKATANGIEVLAENHNHLLLCLDEIGECDAREVGHIAYMLSNGKGKSRMARNTARKKSYFWHLLFLSTGERRLSDIMTEAGQQARGGQEIRLCDVEADTGKHGIFENLHDFADGREFSDYLREASRNYYGAPLRAYLQEIVDFDREQIKADWRTFETKFISDALAGRELPREVGRVASRFALVAFAGELATRSGITGWTAGEAVKAACEVFRVWMDGREGNGNSDSENAIRQIRLLLEQYGRNRFQDVQFLETNSPTLPQFGYRREVVQGDETETEYLITGENFRAVFCKGFDFKFVANELAARGFLIKGNDGKSSRVERVGKQKPARFFVLSSKMFSEEKEVSTAAGG